MSTILNKLCKPDLNYIPDLESNDRLFQKNKKHLTLLSLIFVLSLIKANFSDGLLFTTVLRSSICLSLLFSFLCFCRTRIWIYYLTITIFLCILPFFICSYAPELCFEVMGVAFSGPATLLLITESKKYFIAFAFAQLLALNTVLKSVFIVTFETMNTELFINKFIFTASGQLLLTVAANVMIQSELMSANKTLCAANKTIRSAIDNSKGFLENFSQEIRNPIQSLIGSLELTLLQSPQSPTFPFVETARVCGEVVLQKINNILDTVELEKDKFKLNPRPIQIYDLVSKVWQLSSELIKKKDLVGLMKIQREVPANLMLDQCRIKQILFNLLNNAVKFTNRGSIYLTIKWLDEPQVTEKCFEPQPYENLDEGLFEKEESFSLLDTSERLYNDSYLILGHLQTNFAHKRLEQSCKRGVMKITLRDSGCGMTVDVFERVFGKFSQISHGARNDVGVGLGLYVTKQLAKKMGGDARAYTKTDIGTTFVVCIPCEGVIV